MKKSFDSIKVKRPIGFTLAAIFGLVVLLSLASVTGFTTYLMGADVQITAENNNLSVNTKAASTVNDKLSTIRGNVFQLLDMTGVISSRNQALARQAETFFFERNDDIAFIYVISKESVQNTLSSDIRIVNNHFFISNEIDASVISKVIESSAEQIGKSCDGETIAINVSPFLNVPSMALLFPWKENGRDQTCIIAFSIESISDIIGTGNINTTYLINHNDELLCHPDTDRVLAGESLKNHSLVMTLREHNQNNDDSRQIPFVTLDAKGKKTHWFGAYEKTAMADIVVITEVSRDIVLDAVKKTFINNIFIMGGVFFLTLIIALVYSKFGISDPIKKLTFAAREIQKGNFDTVLIDDLDANRKDEIGVLNQSTKDEKGFLETFSKFTNKGVAKAIARKEIDFEPHLKDLTIFFSDIRGFTAISDGFKNRFGNDSPREIIGFLNDYMSRMVNCITLSHGNVDKFEGDAVMAVWGILRDENLDFEALPDSDPKKKELAANHRKGVKEDALNAITGTIAMRYALMKYNKDAVAFTEAHKNEERAQYKPHIRIGCGLNTGRATAGIMGSADKMEYTAIGDAVNFASRTESSNKPCGTDILITEDTREILREEIENGTLVVERIPVEFEVKGKGAQHFYGVVNMPNFDIEAFFRQGDPEFTLDPDCAKAVGPTGPKTLNEVRNLLGIDIPDFEKVNLNEEENKIQVKQ